MKKRGNAGKIAGKVLSMGKAWRKARETTKKDEALGEWIPVSPGRYDMQIVKAEPGDYGGARKMHVIFAVVGDREESGELCHTFEGYGSEDRDVWMQRLLISLGASDDELDGVETETDLVDLFQRMIDDQVVCKVKVVDKDGYLNLRVNKLTEVDEDYLFEPAELFEEEGKSGAAAADGESEDDEDDGLPEVGDRVSWKGRKGEQTGEVVGFTEDDKAEVKPDGGKRTVKVDLDKLELLEEDVPEEDEVEEEEAKPAKKSKPAKKPKEPEPAGLFIVVGSRVITEDYGDEYPGTVKSIAPKGGPKAVLVEFDDGDTENFALNSLTLLEGGDEEAGSSSDESEDDDGDELEVGDRVTFKLKGKQVAGEVKALEDDRARVAVDGVRKPTWVSRDELDFEIDD